VATVAHANISNALLLRFRDRCLHRENGCHHPEARVAIDRRPRAAFSDDVRSAGGVKTARFQQPQITGEAFGSVGEDTPRIGRSEGVGG